MIAVVTGAAGFVGSHLAQRLLERGDRVIGLDNLSTGTVGNVALLRSFDRFEFVACDVSRGLPDFERVDALFHFASPASPKDYARLPAETLAVNGPGTEWCCRLARRRRARLIFASTSEVYGDPLEHPQREDYFGNVNPNGPRACYDEGKRYGEAVVSVHWADPDFDGRIVRLFNTYGPRMRHNDGRVVPTFIDQALKGERLTIFGDGRQTRSLSYVDDTVSIVLAYADLEKPSYRVVNVGSDEEITVLHIAMVVAELAQTPPEFAWLAPMPDDPGRRRPDLTRTASMLGTLPKTPLRDGLARTMAAWRTDAFTDEKEDQRSARAL